MPKWLIFSRIRLFLEIDLQYADLECFPKYASIEGFLKYADLEGFHQYDFFFRTKSEGSCFLKKSKNIKMLFRKHFGDFIERGLLPER